MPVVARAALNEGPVPQGREAGANRVRLIALGSPGPLDDRAPRHPTVIWAADPGQGPR